MKTPILPFRALTLGLGAGALAFGLTPISPISPISLTTPAAAQSASDLDAVVGALRAISTRQADFTQTDRQGATLRGQMTLKRPGKIRFDYGKDSDFLVISNGKSLFVVDYEVNQVERWPIGNSPLGALFRVILPVSAPGLAATALYGFVLSWSDYAYARTFLTSAQGNWTANLGITTMKGEYISNWADISAASILVALPILLIYLFFERYLVGGLTAGSDK
jgi:hypothetical protein